MNTDPIPYPVMKDSRIGSLGEDRLRNQLQPLLPQARTDADVIGETSGNYGSGKGDREVAHKPTQRG